MKTILRIVMPYVVFAGLWILLSDRLLEVLVQDAAARIQWSIYKGWAFVFVTALLLFVLLRVEMKARIRIEEALRKTNRALKVISECNQVLVRATSEAELLRQVCALLVEHGGYRMTWVGFAEPDEAKSVRPVAQAGFETGYLETVNITWADTERGRGPTGTAIRTGQPVVARNIPADPDYAPWRAAAIQRGYVSSVALPLAGGQGAFGALMVYAAEPEAFDAEELGLLSELAGDLAYGITALRTRADRERTEAALRQSQALVRVVTEGTPDAIYVKDTQGRYLMANPGTLQFLGKTQAGVIGHDDTALFPPDDARQIMAGDRRVMDSGATQAYEEFITIRGQPRTFLSTKGPWRDAQGRVVGVFGIARDITERKQAEALLSGQNQVLELISSGAPLVEALTALVSIIEAQAPGMVGSILLLDEDAVHVRHGAAPSLPAEFIAAIDGEPIGPCAGSCGTAAFRKEAVFVEDIATDPLWATYNAKALPHGLRACWSTPIFDESHRVLGTFAMYYRQPSLPRPHHRRLIDVATHTASIAISRHRTEAALATSEEQFRESFYRAGVGKVQAEPVTGHFLRVNPAFCEFTGYPEAELLGKTFAEITLPDDHEADAALYARLLRREIPTFAREKRYVRKEGDVVWGSVSVTLLFDADGRASLATAVVQDITARKLAEAERQKFIMLADSSSEFIGMCDLDLKPLYVNPAGVRMVGLPDMDAARRVKVQDYFFPEDQRFITEEFFPRVLREGHGDVEIRLRHFQTGEPIWMFYYLFSVRDASGTVVGWATVSRDITERKRAGAALRESEERLRLVLDGLGSQMFVGLLDTDGVVLVANRPALEAAGLRVQDVLGQPVHETYWFTYSDAVAQRFRAAVQRATQGETVRYDEQIRVAEGRLIWVAFCVNPLRDESGKVVFLVPSGVVIDKRKQAEEALRESEERLRLALNAAHMGTFDWDVPGDRITWSRWHEELWGFKPGEFGGTYEAFTERVHPEDLSGINAEVARCIAARAPFSSEFRVVWPDGSVHWIESVGEFSFDATGHPLRMRGAVLETTERKQAEEVVRQSREQLRALTARLQTLREEERTRISREIHDELGQMLTALKMDLRWIEHRLDDFGDDRRLNPVLDKLVATAELTDATVKTVQRIAAELRPGILDKLGLGAALQYEAAQFQERVGVACRVQLPAADTPVSPEVATAFFRIFQEALTNVARHAHATAVEVEFRPEADVCRLEIRDNGRGISGIDPASPKSLGLLGMQERARLLGGDVAFTARPGGGTVVAVQIPNRSTHEAGV